MYDKITAFNQLVMIEFKPALPEEFEILSDLAIESKSHWGYSPEQLDLWRPGLRVEKEYIRRNTVRTIWSDSQLVGFFAIKAGKENELEHLWLLPRVIGKGVGTRAFEEIKKEGALLGMKSLFIVSDPNAEDFYLKQEAKRIGEVESIPQNRFLPKLRYDLNVSNQRKLNEILP